MAKSGAATRQDQFAAPASHGPKKHLKTIEDFRKNRSYSGDGNRIDLAYAVYALSHGVSEGAIRQAISSRDLSKKGSEQGQRQYIDRTIAKALAGAGRYR